MNASRHLARGLRHSFSQLSVRSLSTAKCVVRYRQIQNCSVCLNLSAPKPLNQARLMSSAAKFEVINVQDEDDFKKRVIETSSSTPVVVDFYATWCGPCRILGPRLESFLSTQEDGKVLMAKVDIDQIPDLAMEYGVSSVPTVVGVKNGKVQNQFVGVKDDDELSTFVDKLVAS